MARLGGVCWNVFADLADSRRSWQRGQLPPRQARCDKKLSSIVISALKEAITASGKYRLVSSLDDEGKLDLVHTI